MERAYGSYNDLVASDVDVVYIATGHLDHFEHARLGLEAGKPVLIEKPMTPRLSEARALTAYAREKGLFAMEAVSSLALPRYSCSAPGARQRHARRGCRGVCERSVSVSWTTTVPWIRHRVVGR
nr:Gfo/Idh/MocA family oxidoreductase [Nesterenkonia muleiensis]